MLQWQQEAAQLRREELELLARDARLLPRNAAIQYRYGLSLYLNGAAAGGRAGAPGRLPAGTR